MSLPRPDVDPDGLLEFSVVFTDRSLNHMSKRFVAVMQDVIDVLRTTYGAHTVAVVPGGGTYAMEAVARQLATGRRCLVVRNGLFSYRWSQILDAGSVASETTVCRARPASDEPQAPWSPAAIDEVVEAIERDRPEVVFAAHVETAAGVLLPDDYVRALAEATHAVGGLLVLDCIASGALWVDMTQLGVDVLRTTYGAETVAVVPGGGTYAMEAVARQLATGRRCLVVRNGLFSYRWSQIFDAGSVAAETTVCTARPGSDERQAPWTPPPVEDVVEAIGRARPEVVFAAHVETAAGILLPDDYVRTVAAATHAAGGLLVLDCIASGALWVDMTELGVDVLLSAPQKGWSGSPCAGFVMLSEAGRAQVMATTSTSFAADLQKWLTITEAYTHGQTPYHATMPTDALARDAALMLETRAAGLAELRQAQASLGAQVRGLLADHGFPSVAAEEFAAPSVVVAFTDDPEIKSGAKLKARGIQVAAGVPLMCGEGDDFSTFRVGLFGLDKLTDVDGTVERLRAHLRT